MHDMRQYLCYWIFTDSESPIEWTAVQHLTYEDLITPYIGRKIVESDELVNTRIATKGPPKGLNLDNFGINIYCPNMMPE